MKLKKGSAAAKAFMAKIRAKKGKSKKTTLRKVKPKAKAALGSKLKLSKKENRLGMSSSTHTDTKSHNYHISISGVHKNFKNFIKYKGHIIDIAVLHNNKKEYIVNSVLGKPVFFTDKLATAKNFVSRIISITKKVKK
jgi:hypothetical protein